MSTKLTAKEKILFDLYYMERPWTNKEQGITILIAILETIVFGILTIVSVPHVLPFILLLTNSFLALIMILYLGTESGDNRFSLLTFLVAILQINADRNRQILKFKKNIENKDVDTEVALVEYKQKMVAISAQFEEFNERITEQIEEIDSSIFQLNSIDYQRNTPKATLIEDLKKDLKAARNTLWNQRKEAEARFEASKLKFNADTKTIKDHTALVEILRSQRVVSRANFLIEENKLILQSIHANLSALEGTCKSLNSDLQCSINAISELREVTNV